MKTRSGWMEGNIYKAQLTSSATDGGHEAQLSAFFPVSPAISSSITVELQVRVQLMYCNTSLNITKTNARSPHSGVKT